MRVSKRIMNPARLAQLKIIEQAGETNAMFVMNRSHKNKEQIDLSLLRFAENGLIKFTGGGYFEITEKGRVYLGKRQEKVY